MTIHKSEYLRDSSQQRKPQPGFEIEDCLFDMTPFPDSRCHPHLVHAQSLNRKQLFLMLEELCLHGRVRHEDEAYDRGDNGQKTAK